MKPYELVILLHYHEHTTDPVQYIDMSGQQWRDTINRFFADELLTEEHSEFKRTYKLTERGQCFIEDGLMKVALPVAKWQIPNVEHT